MGYRSDIYIGISKELYVKCQLLNNIPKALQEVQDKSVYDHTVYWFIEGWKWYTSFPDVQEMEDWFSWCSDEEENPLSSQDIPLFGAIRLGEGIINNELDVEEWGDPGHFDLYVSSHLSRP